MKAVIYLWFQADHCHHTDADQLSFEDTWEVHYLPYVHKTHGQVVPLDGSEWRFQRWDVHNNFKTLTYNDICSVVKKHVSTDMIGVHSIALFNLQEVPDPGMMSYLFYRYYAPFMIVKVKEGKASIEIPERYVARFLLRSEASEQVTRQISSQMKKFDDMASMERSVTSREAPEDNKVLGGIYQRLEPRCIRETLRHGHKLVSNILQDFPFVSKDVVFADLGAGMNQVPLYASAMFAWRSLGIECVQNRIFLAAQAQQVLFEHDWFKHLKVAMFCQNLATSECNWAGILCFLCWDKV